MTLEILTLIDTILVGLNICILALAVKLYTEAIKNYILIKRDKS